MGLDMWLTAKTKKRENNEHTGVCSGLFNIIPKSVDDKVQIGYWRKAYDQQDLILRIQTSGENEEGEIRILPDEIDKIIEESTKILNTHVFDEEDGYDITGDYDGYYSTFYSKQKWKDTIEFFKEAKKILEEDPEAEIYYAERA